MQQTEQKVKNDVTMTHLAKLRNMEEKNNIVSVSYWLRGDQIIQIPTHNETSVGWTPLETPAGAHYREVSLYHIFCLV